MSAVSVPTRYKLSVEDYHKLGHAGILTEDSRVELIDGELIEMAPIGGPHMHMVNRLTKLLVTAVGDSAVVSIQNPVTLPPHSEPQPDVAILKAEVSARETLVPESKDVLLLIEVADSSLAYDRQTKLRLYAANEIPEVWIVDVNAGVVEVYRQPTRTGYTRVAVSGEIAPQALPQVTIKLEQIFG